MYTNKIIRKKINFSTCSLFFCTIFWLKKHLKIVSFSHWVLSFQFVFVTREDGKSIGGPVLSPGNCLRLKGVPFNKLVPVIYLLCCPFVRFLWTFYMFTLFQDKSRKGDNFRRVRSLGRPLRLLLSFSNWISVTKNNLRSNNVK